jgi:hypothetical protein
MEFNATIDLIIKDLDEAGKIIDDLKNYPGVPALQVELAKSKCKSAGEVIGLLKSMKDNQSVAITSPPVVKTSPAIVKTAPPDVITPPPAEKKEESKKNLKIVSEPAIIADNFSHLSKRFTEPAGNLKSNVDVSEILEKKPLTSLSEAIGVNDKFLFISEIFEGNKDAYKQALLRLENAHSLSDARAVIMSYTGDKAENEAVKQLLSLVKRKLPSDE